MVSTSAAVGISDITDVSFDEVLNSAKGLSSNIQESSDDSNIISVGLLVHLTNWTL